MKLGLMLGLLALLAACDAPEIGGSPSEVCHAEDGSCEYNESTHLCDCHQSSSGPPATKATDAGH